MAAGSGHPAAVKAATDFLGLIDAANWPASYAATNSNFRTVNTLQVWQSASEGARAGLGRVVSRSLLSVDLVPAPPKGYRMVRVKTDFANKRGVRETVSLDRQGSGGKAGSYHHTTPPDDCTRSLL